MPRKISTPRHDLHAPPTKADRLAANNAAADKLQLVLNRIYDGAWKPKGNGGITAKE